MNDIDTLGLFNQADIDTLRLQIEQKQVNRVKLHYSRCFVLPSPP